jgi:hypothetical protein
LRKKKLTRDDIEGNDSFDAADLAMGASMGCAMGLFLYASNPWDEMMY